MKGLTKRQRDLLNFIEAFIEKHAYSPSYREIMEYFGFSSLGTVYKHLKTLKRKGLLFAEKQCSRSLSLDTIHHKQLTANEEIEIPFIGHLTSGFPIETFPQTQTLGVPRFLVHQHEKTYILRIRGDTLNDEQMTDGDLIIVEARSEAHAGDTIVGLIHHHDAVIKRYYPEGNYIRLEGNNPNHPPFILKAEEVAIQGIVTGLLRQF